MSQIPLSFPHNQDYAETNFIVSEANQEAYTWLDSWPDWPGRGLIISGPRYSGKTHLAHIWQHRTKAQHVSQDTIHPILSAFANSPKPIVMEDADQWQDLDSWFHLCNLIKEHNQTLLVTSQTPVNELQINLPDLASRLQAMAHTHIDNPDDMLLQALIVKLLSDRQLSINEDAIHYLVPRLERSYEAIHLFVETLDAHALSHKRNITLPLLREVLKIT